MLDLIRRLFTALPLEVDTSGPPEPPSSSPWLDGWHGDYERAPAHPGRLGQQIAPWAVVLHETQMHPSSFRALVRRTRGVAGRGNCYHFLLGRTPEQGLVQVSPVTRNANHAGGPSHGWITTASGGAVRKYHPNLVSVGIELHCAGTVRRVGGAWRTVDDGKPFGAPIPDDEVRASPGSPLGEHLPTAWQLDRLRMLLEDLRLVLAARPEGALGVTPNGEPRRVPALSRAKLPLYSHRELDPARKTDPGREVLTYLAALDY